MADSIEPQDIPEDFLEYLGMKSWELVAVQTNLKSRCDSLHSMRTTAAEILRLTRFELAMGTLNMPQAKLYWSRLCWLPLIC